MTDLRTARVAERPDPAAPPDPADVPDSLELPDVPALAGGVDLSRLTALARLTPAQALEIALGVLEEPETSGAGGVVVGPGGRVVVRPPGPAVEAVLAHLAGAARSVGRRADPATDRLLAALDEAVTELPIAAAPAVARRLREAAATTDRPAVRAELAALVRAVGGAAGPPGGAAPVPAVVGAAEARRAPAGEARTARRRTGAWLLSVLVLAAVVLLEVVVLHDRVATDLRVLLDAGRSGSSSSAAAEPDRLPRAPAPAAAGSVSGVDLRLLAPCAPGAPCSLRLLVGLVPGADPRVVTWSYRIVDRCTGASSTVPGGSVTVAARGQRAVAVGSVALPAVPAVAVVAVTELPAAAASSPVFVGTCPSRSTG